MFQFAFRRQGAALIFVTLSQHSVKPAAEEGLVPKTLTEPHILKRQLREPVLQELLF